MKYHSLPLSTLTAWSHLNSIELRGIEIAEHIIVPATTSISNTTSNDNSGASQGIVIDKGGGILATSHHAPGDLLLKVPADMVLCADRVKEARRVDALFASIMDALEETAQKVREEEGRGRADWVQTPRGAVLVFLVYQMTIANLEVDKEPTGTSTKTNGVKTSLTDYVSFLPKDIPLPTFYNDYERQLLLGTSLFDALDQKQASLEREFDLLRSSTENIEWCQTSWWDDETGILHLDNWKLADAMYRSRALQLPNGVGDAMVPVLDMANHASDGRSNARFEVDADGSTLLVVRDDKEIMQGEEITITYGFGGACEMLFSYGFLEEGASNAREMFLGLEMPLDDPLRVAKIRFSEEAPGVRLYLDEAGSLKWDSAFVWWACVNEEDGLDFRVVQSTDGQRELQATWKEDEFQANALKSLIMKDDLRDIFVLRATVLIQQRVENQGMQLAESEQPYEQGMGQTGVQQSTWKLVGQLRDLELELVTTAYNALETEVGFLHLEYISLQWTLSTNSAQKAALLDSEVVSRYFGGAVTAAAEQNVGSIEDDFS